MAGQRLRRQQVSIAIFFLVIPLSYFAGRIINLAKFPIFNDEAFYIHWAAIIRDHPGSLWISLVDGKTPLFYWINALTIGLFKNPLISGRAISVASGMLTICLFYAAGHYLGRFRSGIIAGILYLLLPYAFFNDRLATVDSFHTALITACLYMSIRCSHSETLSLSGAIGLGLTMAAAFLAKTPTLLFIPLPLLMILLTRKDRLEHATLLKLLLAYSVLAITMIIYLTCDVPMIGSGGSRIFHRSRFFIPIGELLQFPVEMWARNFRDLGGYLWTYFTPTLTLIGIASILVSFLRHRRTTFLIALWTLAPMAAMLLLTRETFSRYYLVVVVPMLFLIGLEFDHFVEWAGKSGEQGKVRGIIVILTIPAMILFFKDSIPPDLAYMYCPNGSPLVARDQWQYLDGYPSGYGIDRVVNYLKNQAAMRRITVFTTMNWGNPDDAVLLYLRGVPDAQVVECFWWDKLPLFPSGKETIPLINNKFQRQIIGDLNLGNLGQIYFVTRSNPFPRELFETMNPDARLIIDAPKPGGTDSTYLYRL